FNWIDITSRPGVQTVTGLADDNSAAGMASLGFNFHYYWNDYSQLKIGSNGWMSFDNVSNIASCFPIIPTVGNGENILPALMGDLNFTGAGNPGVVRYWTNNIDSFIISYINVPFWVNSGPGWSGSNTFQVILCNSDSSITYQYGALGGFTANGACNDMTVGIENSTGGIGLAVHTDAMPPANYVIRFDYPAVVLLSIVDPLPQWNVNNGNLAKFILNNSAFQLQSNIRNAGNTNVSTAIDLQANVINSASTFVYTSAPGTIPTLAAGDDSLFTYTPLWTPTVTGQYIYRSFITNSQDINSVNNMNETELEVVDPCVPNMVLSYNTTITPNGSLNWNGGANDDGAAVYFEPPVYPYTVASVQYYISSNVGNGYISQVYDDDGPNGGPGTLLFTTTVPAASVVSGNWNTVTVTPTVTLNSGGFYVVWLQGGTNIFLGTETNGPRSHHNYEILDNAWSTYRSNEQQDLCIRAAINGYQGTPTSGMTLATNLLDVSVTNTTTGLATSWLWDFGDLSTSTLQNPPTHTYAAPGTYTVCLTATSQCGSSQTCDTITVCALPTAGYTSSTSLLTANFTDVSTGGATSWSWDFGDSNTSTSQNPSHTYASGGTYNVCLIVMNACSQADTICQTVSVCDVNSAGFSQTGGVLTANFSDLSTGAIDDWSWDFGDSNTSTTQSPTHTYASAGTYTVCLIVSNSCGNSDTTCQAVTVCDVNVAAFGDSTHEDSVYVTDMSTGTGITTWLWDYGDGNFANVQNPPPHSYATGGVYTVCLTTTDTCGVVDSVCHTVVIMITGLENNSAGVSEVYPNPANDVLVINLNASANSTVEVFDITGKAVLTEQQSGQKLLINVSGLAEGMYVLRVTNASGVSVSRFVKE
ncbi:MAG TPA: PKD domain-containing protein, partial [Bacteroidia bacterium]|nr:PKD domain-containing protein [Bacteroidia bacterium]